ncbi:N-acetylmuramate alpha-1-phosphate uridylyltransferase MurU [Thalassotalea sp. PLHSN55]|uniref:N-acetylmuramate alpha-1-phosphate uridylyltransferase MurU n=1 Tax=Thalassotalea sp. PLHSN55 TaxID=3435888 RepID=UPI003F83029E
MITKAIILAAGRGERMRPLTDVTPKPLIRVAGIPLLEHHLIKLARAGITDIVINHAWLGQQIVDYFADGKKWGVNICYSAEEQGALETAGGIINAMPQLLENNPSKQFLVINGDVYTDIGFENLPVLAPDILAHLYLVPNPEHNLTGDFAIDQTMLINKLPINTSPSFTYSGIGLYHSDFFKDLHNCDQASQQLALGPLLRANAQLRKLTASVCNELWTDVGTPQRLADLNAQLAAKS